VLFLGGAVPDVARYSSVFELLEAHLLGARRGPPRLLGAAAAFAAAAAEVHEVVVVAHLFSFLFFILIISLVH
jgi:hypothetical protein